MSTLTTDELKKGDILIFRGDKKEWISVAIMLLTNSDVSHSALYLGDHYLADEALSGSGKHKIVDDPDGFFVYVNRLQDTVLPLDPVVQAADRYLTECEPYSISDLVMLALIILYKKLSISSPAKKVIIKIFMRAAEVIVKGIDKKKYPGKTPMICSQFVYQCYEDCGKPYTLTIKNGTLLSEIPQKFGISAATSPCKYSGDNQMQSILDKVIEQYQNLPASSILSDYNSFAETEEELAKLLVNHLRGNPDTPIETELNEDDRELHVAAIELCKALATFHDVGSSNTEDILQFAKEHLSYFVTPADLKSCCTNVKNAGTVLFKRE